MKKSVLTLVVIVFLAINSFAQVAINETGATPSASAILDLSSDNKGLLIPRMTTNNRTNDVTTVAGLLVYDTDTDSFWYYDGQWIEIAKGNALNINGLSDGKTTYNNLYLGEYAGLGTSSGAQNTGIGYNALKGIDDAWNNVALGYSALIHTSSGGANVAIGSASLFENLTGKDNTGIGTSSLASNTSGDYNVAVGRDASYFNLTGNNNTAIGYKAGEGSYNTSYSGCVLVGFQAGMNNSDDNKLFITNSDDSTPLIGGDFTANRVDINGTIKIIDGSEGSGKVLTSDADGVSSWETPAVYASSINGLSDAKTPWGTNIYLGENAGENDAAGAQYNTVIGIEALNNISHGAYNTAIGYQAGGNFSDYNNCVYIGYQAGFFNTNDDKLFIDNSLTSTPLIGGDFDANRVDINGTIKIVDGSEGSGKVLTSDADGDATWETPTTYASDINGLSDAIKSDSYMFMGTDAGINNTGGYNIGIGFEALKLNSTGTHNSAFGYKSLDVNTEGKYNSAFGLSSLGANTNGDQNTAIGYQSLLYNSTGTNNTAVGFNAGKGSSGISRSGCIYIGSNAGANNTSNNKLFIDNTDTDTPLIGGDFNSNRVDINGTIKITGGSAGSDKVLTSDADGDATWETTTINGLSDAVKSGSYMFMGTNAGINNTGDYNLGVGYEALKNNTTGRYNTVFGYKSLDANIDGDYNLAFGVNSLGTNISGISNTAVGHNSLLYNTGSGNTAVGFRSLEANTTGNYNTAIGYMSSAPGVFSNSIVIGAHAISSGSNQIQLGNASITEIKGQVLLTKYSDGRIKENIKEDVKGLEFITKLRPVTYNINLDKENQLLGITDDSNLPSKYDIEKVKMSGFIAQEVEVAAKETNYDFSGIQKPKHDKDLYGLSYAEFVVPLVKGMQEQQEIIETLTAENAELKARLDRLEQLIPIVF